MVATCQNVMKNMPGVKQADLRRDAYTILRIACDIIYIIILSIIHDITSHILFRTIWLIMLDAGVIITKKSQILHNIIHDIIWAMHTIRNTIHNTIHMMQHNIIHIVLRKMEVNDEDHCNC